LRNGGNVFVLQKLLGHSTLAMSQRYLTLLQSDLESSALDASPGDHLLP
jgi:site-specific recombinase XerD